MRILSHALPADHDSKAAAAIMHIISQLWSPEAFGSFVPVSTNNLSECRIAHLRQNGKPVCFLATKVTNGASQDDRWKIIPHIEPSLEDKNGRIYRFIYIFLTLLLYCYSILFSLSLYRSLIRMKLENFSRFKLSSRFPMQIIRLKKPANFQAANVPTRSLGP